MPIPCWIGGPWNTPGGTIPCPPGMGWGMGLGVPGNDGPGADGIGYDPGCGIGGRGPAGAGFCGAAGPERTGDIPGRLCMVWVVAGTGGRGVAPPMSRCPAPFGGVPYGMSVSP